MVCEWFLFASGFCLRVASVCEWFWFASGFGLRVACEWFASGFGLRVACEWFARPLANYFASGLRDHSQIILRVVSETTRKLFASGVASGPLVARATREPLAKTTRTLHGNLRVVFASGICEWFWKICEWFGIACEWFQNLVVFMRHIDFASGRKNFASGFGDGP
jgi:hypothetical protein